VSESGNAEYPERDGDGPETCVECGEQEDTNKDGHCEACARKVCEQCGTECGPAHNILIGASWFNFCDDCEEKYAKAIAQEAARESAGDDAYDRAKDDGLNAKGGAS
jgi:16S rRNA U1498 N3-methylase RsmE